MMRFQGELDNGQLWKLLFCLLQCFLNRCIDTHTHTHTHTQTPLTQLHSFLLFIICFTEEIHHTLFDQMLKLLFFLISCFFKGTFRARQSYVSSEWTAYYSFSYCKCHHDKWLNDVISYQNLFLNLQCPVI